MTLGIRRTRRADPEIDEIWAYIATENVAAAERVVDRIEAAERQLREFPEIGQARPDLGPGLRHRVVGQYLILYRVAPDAIEILRVLHGARDSRREFGP